jgi:hypothetical protein
VVLVWVLAFLLYGPAILSSIHPLGAHTPPKMAQAFTECPTTVCVASECGRC